MFSSFTEAYSNILTSILAACALPGYALRGVYEQLRTVHYGNVFEYVIDARFAQGADESRDLSDKDWAEIVNNWFLFKLRLEHSHGLLEPAK